MKNSVKNVMTNYFCNDKSGEKCNDKTVFC